MLKGDFVEIAYDDYAELGIVQDFDAAGGSYTVVACNIDEKGHTEYCDRLCDATCVLPTSFPVQKKYAAALRRGLKQAKKNSADELPF